MARGRIVELHHDRVGQIYRIQARLVAEQLRSPQMIALHFAVILNTNTNKNKDTEKRKKQKENFVLEPTYGLNECDHHDILELGGEIEALDAHLAAQVLQIEFEIVVVNVRRHVVEQDALFVKALASLIARCAAVVVVVVVVVAGRSSSSSSRRC